MPDRDERFAYRNGKQLGLNWSRYGNLPDPERPVVDPGVGDPLSPPKTPGVSTDWRVKKSYAESQARGALRGGQTNRRKAA